MTDLAGAVVTMERSIGVIDMCSFTATASYAREKCSGYDTALRNIITNLAFLHLVFTIAAKG